VGQYIIALVAKQEEPSHGIVFRACKKLISIKMNEWGFFVVSP
jgi:hypothetical protein